MYPYFFPDSLHLSSYAIFFLLAVIVIVWWSRYMIKKHTQYNHHKIVLLLVLCVVAGILGARLLHVLTRRSSYTAHPDLIFSFSLHWFSWYGALLLMLLVWVVVCLAWKWNPFKLADLGAPSLGAGIAIMRLWCFLHGCCFGKATDLPRWVRPEPWSEAATYQLYNSLWTGNLFWSHDLHPVHPTQLYDALLAGSWAYLSYRLWKKWLPAWVSSLFFLVWYTVGRYFLAPFRSPSLAYDATPTLFPIIYLVILFLAGGIVLLYNGLENKKIKK